MIGVKINLFIFQKVCENIADTYNRDTQKADDFDGFLIGTISDNNNNITDVHIKSIETQTNNSENLDSDSYNYDLDFSMKMAIAEDEIFANGTDYYIVGMLRSHNGLGITPSPGDLLDLSTLQSINPNAVLMVIDIFQAKSAERMGFKFYQLKDASNPNGDIIEISWMMEDFNEIFVDEIIRRLNTNQLNFAQIDALINKALANIQTNAFEDAESFLKQAKNMVGDNLDSELAEKINLNLLEIEYRRYSFGKVLHGLEKLKSKYREKGSQKLFGEMALLLGRTLIKMGKIDMGLKAIDEAIRYFKGDRKWKRLGFAYSLKALVLLPNLNPEIPLKMLIEGLMALSNMRSDDKRHNVINKLNIEQNAKNLIKTLPEPDQQSKYLSLLNEISEAHGYKIILEDF